ncbi:hypothetical protein B0H14DRAFT_3431201 [Mycena olivaceomarginata]|nr:hypothetical protein B0H14DRAFT_3431201 [Mycena olivaceomarginata]
MVSEGGRGPGQREIGQTTRLTNAARADITIVLLPSSPDATRLNNNNNNHHHPPHPTPRTQFSSPSIPDVLTFGQLVPGRSSLTNPLQKNFHQRVLDAASTSDQMDVSPWKKPPFSPHKGTRAASPDDSDEGTFGAVNR